MLECCSDADCVLEYGCCPVIVVCHFLIIDSGVVVLECWCWSVGAGVLAWSVGAGVLVLECCCWSVNARVLLLECQCLSVAAGVLVLECCCWSVSA